MAQRGWLLSAVAEVWGTFSEEFLRLWAAAPTAAAAYPPALFGDGSPTAEAALEVRPMRRVRWKSGGRWCLLIAPPRHRRTGLHCTVGTFITAAAADSTTWTVPVAGYMWMFTAA